MNFGQESLYTINSIVAIDTANSPRIVHFLAVVSQHFNLHKRIIFKLIKGQEFDVMGKFVSYEPYSASEDSAELFNPSYINGAIGSGSSAECDGTKKKTKEGSKRRQLCVVIECNNRRVHCAIFRVRSD